MYEQAKDVLKQIVEHGYLAYIVGGYARDKYIGDMSDDIDICTNAPQSLINELFTVLKTNFASSVIRVNCYKFELTLFRKDIIYVNNRYPSKIELVKTLAEDLKRRDFVMNTLCIDFNGNYIDLLGARKDIDSTLVRTVGDANIKLQEDSLRILRAIRLATVLNFKLDSKLVIAIYQNYKLVSKLSNQTLKKEVSKILASNNRDYGIKLLKEFKLEYLLNLK